MNLNDTAIQIHQRRERLLREAEATRLSQDGRNPQPGLTSRLMVRVGDMLVASGTRLKARYQVPEAPTLLDANTVMQP